MPYNSPVLNTQLDSIDQPHYRVISSAGGRAVALFPDLVARLARDTGEGQRSLQIEFEKLRGGSICSYLLVYLLVQSPS